MKLEAPIPGGNYTSDVRNYSWHRPPDLVGYDEAVNYLIERIDEPEEIELIYAMLGIDAHITTIVSTILLQAVSKGKVGVDLALLIAGPLARYIEISAKDVGIKYEMGVEDKNRVIITPTLLKASLGILDDDDEEQIEEEALPEESANSSLMAMPDNMTATPEEQETMLGGASEEEAPVEEELVNEL
tara:strand:- start:297 stop:857 length:561 start_codon:yes stop_codon:yes gene_type:complete